jgi:hypothetical protein
VKVNPKDSPMSLEVVMRHITALRLQVNLYETNMLEMTKWSYKIYNHRWGILAFITSIERLLH